MGKITHFLQEQKQGLEETTVGSRERNWGRRGKEKRWLHFIDNDVDGMDKMWTKCPLEQPAVGRAPGPPVNGGECSDLGQCCDFSAMC